METRTIDEENPLWQKLFEVWVASGKPGWVLLGGQQFKVLQPGDDKVLFTQQGGFDEYYGSQTGGIS